MINFIVQEMVDGLNFEEFIKETEANENIREKSLNNIVDIVMMFMNWDINL